MSARRPAWLPLAAAAVCALLFVGLGTWQLQRADDKQALIAAIERGADAPAVALPQESGALAERAWRRVRVQGRFLAGRQFLLDNRIHEGRAGFDVLTPLLRPDGRAVLVDRGWVPAGPRREPQAPIALDAPGSVTVTGRLWLPEAGLALGPALAPVAGDEPRWPRLVTRVDYAAMGRALGRDLVPAVVRADGEAPWVLTPRPPAPAFGPARHYGYAVQWFALALTVVAVTLILRLRRRRKDDR